jgi:hypothetical protein
MGHIVVRTTIATIFDANGDWTRYPSKIIGRTTRMRSAYQIVLGDLENFSRQGHALLDFGHADGSTVRTSEGSI